jgi:hypothetical protein
VPAAPSDPPAYPQPAAADLAAAAARTRASLPPGAPAANSDAREPAGPDESADFAAALRTDARGRPKASFQLTRWVFLRALGFIYVVAFAILVNQGQALLGADGLLPAAGFVERIKRNIDFTDHPTLFWFDASDAMLRSCAWLGLGLALLMLLGVDHTLVILTLWILYESFVHIGQIFYGYGWETLLLETGFLAVFFGTTRIWTCRREQRVLPRLLFVWLCWLTFRLMFGAGMIKLRGDSCWRDLTCLYYHYETQPVPHALSRVLHHAPQWFHVVGVAFNHFVEVIVPFGLFVPRTRNWAALLTIAFQLFLVISGNLSFLNWLTIAVALGCIDDSWYARVLPLQAATAQPPSRTRLATTGLYSAVVVLLSIEPALNLLSQHQQMNSSFEPLHIVNTYGAFGSIGRERDEVILEGTTDADPVRGRYRAYDFKCKPGDVARAPCLITPYHYRLDWQMWFAALSTFDRQPWLASLIHKLLQNDRQALSLIAKNPFPRAPPRFIRAERYRYHFTELGSDAYWKRERLGSYAPPLSRDDPRLLRFLATYGLAK